MIRFKLAREEMDKYLSSTRLNGRRTISLTGKVALLMNVIHWLATRIL